MRQHEPLARATLDTLPMNIAVLDGDGTILFTNRTWQDYGESQSEVEETDFTGKNYFAGIDRTSDSYAARAVEGIQSVMDGEETLFTLEYPCDTPEESQWFLMRVVPLSSDDGDEVVVAHIDITERKLAELRAEERARELQAERQRLEHLIQRINGLVQDVMEAVMEAETRADIQRTLCEQFVGAEPFVATEVGELDLTSDEIRPVCANGTNATEGTVMLDDEDDPTARAAVSRQLQVVQDTRDLPEGSVHHERCPDARAIAALPLVADDTLYGVLTAYAGERNAFDERETTILEALGRTVATAINAIERKRILTADELVEVELAVESEEGFLFELSRTVEQPLEYAGSVRDGESYLVFYTAEGEAAETVLARAADHPTVSAATHVSDFDGRAFFEFRIEDPPIVSALAEFGAETREITVDGGTATVRAELAADAKVRALVDSLSEQFGSAELLAYRERKRPTQTRQEFVSNLMEALTDRQRTAIQKAYVGGFFEWPRGTSGEDLADSMDISPSTYHQHLRAAQRKVFDEIFGR